MKKKITFFLFFLVSFVLKAQVPSLEWQMTFGGSQADDFFGIEMTSDGGYIMIGSTLSTDGDVVGSVHGSTNCWVVKTNAVGTIEWQRTYGGSSYDTGHEIHQTSDGYIFVAYTGSSNGDVTGYHGGYDIWLVKIDNLGGLLWQKAIGASLGDFSKSIVVTADGGCVLAGQRQMPLGYLDGFVAKINSLGVIEWQQTYGGSSNDMFTCLKQTTDGGYIICGQAGSDDGDITDNHGGLDGWVVKINNIGQIQWKKTFGGTTTDHFESIEPTLDGGYITVGYTNSHDGDVVNNLGNWSMWVVKLNGLGAIQWQVPLTGFNGNCIKQTADGGYVISGATGSQTLNNFLILKLNENGIVQWQKTTGGSSAESAWDIQQTNDGGFIVTGITESTNGDVTNNHGGQDAWVVKLGPESLGNASFNHDLLAVFPNPANTILNLQLSSDIEKVAILDISGKILLEQSENTNQFNIESLASGMYIIHAFSVGQKFQTKFIKQ